jgi:sugar phosphate isomerase/epimerase
MTVTALSPGVFKCPPEDAQITVHLDRLRETLPLCKRINVNLVIVFPIQNPAWSETSPNDGGITSQVIEAFREAGRLAANAGVRIAIENEPGYTAVSSRGLATLIDRIGLDNVGANWDPGNAFPYDNGIDNAVTTLNDRIFNVHAKDTWVREGRRGFDSIGGGQIDWRRQVDDLRRIGYQGALTVETHCVPGVEKSRASVDVFTSWLKG